MTSAHPAGEDILAVLMAWADDADQAALHAHIDACDACRAQYAAMMETLAMVAVAAAPAPVPPHLRERVLAAVGVAVDEPTRPAPGQRWWIPRPRWRPALAVMAVTGLAIATSVALLFGGATAPVTRSFALSGVPGAVTVRGQHALLTSRWLAMPGAGRTYELWVIRQGQPLPAGTFTSAAGSVAVLVAVRHGDTVAVTVERAGGSRRPTHAPIARVVV